jgi:type II secretion system protein N
MPDRKTLIRRLFLAAYFAAAFLVFLLLLFPFDRVKTKLENEVRSRTPVELSVARISPRFFNSFVLSDVVLSDKSGKVLFESPSVRTTVSLFGLVRGLLALDMKAQAYGGELLIKAQQGPGRHYLLLDANGLDIGSYPMLKDLGLKLSGRLGGNFEMTGDAGKGRLWLKGLTSRELKIKGFPIPDLDFEQCWNSTARSSRSSALEIW